MEMLPKKSRTNSNPANITTKMISAANTYPAYVNDKPETNMYINLISYMYLKEMMQKIPRNCMKRVIFVILQCKTP